VTSADISVPTPTPINISGASSNESKYTVNAGNARSHSSQPGNDTNASRGSVDTVRSRRAVRWPDRIPIRSSSVGLKTVVHSALNASPGSG